MSRLRSAIFALLPLVVASAVFARPIVIQQRQVIMVDKKRTPPPVVAPLRVNDRLYRVGHESDTDGMVAYVEAYAADGQTRLWRTTLYRLRFDSDIEHDKQHVFPTSLTLEGEEIVVMSEDGGRYALNAATGQLMQPIR